MVHVALATEDELSEAVGERLIKDFAAGRLVVSLVRETWNPKRACKRSPSLRRAVLRIEELSQRVR